LPAERPLDFDALAKSLAPQIAPAPAQTAASASTLDIVGMIADRLNRTWNPNCAVADAAGLGVRVRINLDHTGNLISRPHVLEVTGAQAAGPKQAAAEAAIRAIAGAAPFSHLPPDKHQEWRTIIIWFDGKSACAGR
jgi:hypothetical protein